MAWERDEGARDRFISSITAFKHIQYLSMYHFWVEPHLADDSKITRLIEMCSDLKGLHCLDHEDHHGSDIEISLLRAVGHRLHYLRINISVSDEIAALKNINFANLRELQNGNGTVPSLQAILKTAINLEKVSFDNKPELIVETLANCKRLKYLELQDIDNMEITLDALERGLFQTKDLHRDALKIWINTPPSYTSRNAIRPISKPQECVMKLDRIVNSCR